MAVYQGATPRRGLLGGDDALAGARRAERATNTVGAATITRTPALRRRRARSAVRAGRRANRIGMVLGGIVLAFMLAFFSLAQSVRVSATGYDIASLQAESDRLQAARRDLQTDINRLGSDPAIRKLALDQGLSPLAAPLVVPAR